MPFATLLLVTSTLAAPTATRPADERAGDLYDKAVQIWESTSAGSQGRTQLNEEWRRAQLQHFNEARLLAEKASTVRSGVGRRFGEEFPEFVRPQAASTKSE